MTVLESLARFLWDLLYFMTGEGSWRFRPHERLVIEAVVRTLPDYAQTLLFSQLQQIVFVQRSHRQISRPRFYVAPYLPDGRVIEDAEFSEKVVDVLIRVEDGNEVAQVEFFRGRVDSIQFKRGGSFYVRKHISVTGVRPGSSAYSHAAAIDRREHGGKQRRKQRTPKK